MRDGLVIAVAVMIVTAGLIFGVMTVIHRYQDKDRTVKVCAMRGMKAYIGGTDNFCTDNEGKLYVVEPVS